MKKTIWAIQAALFYLFTLLFALLPERLARPAGRLLGRMSALLIRKRHHTAIDNISQALPEMIKEANEDFSLQTPEEGALVDFLGRKAWASKAPVLLARKSGVAIVPAFIHREADRHVIDIYPELFFSGDTSEAGVAADV